MMTDDKYTVGYNLEPVKPIEIRLSGINKVMMDSYSEWLKAQPEYQKLKAEQTAILEKLFAPMSTTDTDNRKRTR